MFDEHYLGLCTWDTEKDYDHLCRLIGENAAKARPDEFRTLRRAASRVKLKQGADGQWRAGGAKVEIRWIEALEHEQRISSCCRHPENHELSAWYSSAEDEAKGHPDIYVFHCPCGRWHRRFCMGGSDEATGKGKRPFWVTDRDVVRKLQAKRLMEMG